MVNDPIVLSRSIVAAEVPFGYEVPLLEGTEVQITQAMGGRFTVLTPEGQMVLIEANDADALGYVVEEQSASVLSVDSDEEVERLVWEMLRTCYDPEIPVNIADLGLIYGVGVTPIEDGGRRVDVQMTLTAPGCGMGEILKMEIEDKLMRIPTVTRAEVDVVFDPPWEMSMMPEAAKLQLGLM